LKMKIFDLPLGSAMRIIFPEIKEFYSFYSYCCKQDKGHFIKHINRL
jgi:hypothetical protein